MRKLILAIAAAAALCVTAAPAMAGAHRGHAPAVLAACAGTYKWATNTGLAPSFWYTQWVRNPDNCQQRSSGLCTNRTTGAYFRGGWVRSTTIRSAASCSGTYPFLRTLWIDIRIGSGHPYTAIRLYP